VLSLARSLLNIKEFAKFASARQFAYIHLFHQPAGNKSTGDYHPRHYYPDFTDLILRSSRISIS
jgi:hypothetical protein